MPTEEAGSTLPPEDYQAIVQLYARYNLASDTGDPADYAACFTADGVLDAGELVVTGRIALEEYKRADQEGRQGMARRHWNGTLLLEPVGPDEVTGTCYLMAFSQVGPRMEHVDSGVYRDTIRRSAAGWGFARRQLTFDVPRAEPVAGGEGTDEALVLGVDVDGVDPSSTFQVVKQADER